MRLVGERMGQLRATGAVGVHEVDVVVPAWSPSEPEVSMCKPVRTSQFLNAALRLLSKAS
jgi:hypothetical protein